MRLDDWLTGVFGLKTFLLALAAGVVLTILFHTWGSVKRAGIEPIDASFGIQPREVGGIITQYRAKARAVYPRFFVLDLFFPVAYALALSLALAFVLRRALPPESAARELSLLPFLAALADYSENLSVLALYLMHPETSDGAARMVAVSNTAKWLLLHLSLLLLVAGVLVLAAKRLLEGRA